MDLNENENRAFFQSLVRIIPFFFGVLIIGIGIVVFSFSAEFLTNGNTVIGEISGYDQVLRIDKTDEIQKKQKIMYQSTISYIVDNEEFHLSPSAYTSSAPEIGTKIKVHYLIEEPWEAKLTSDLLLFPGIFMLLGIIIISVNLFFYIKRKASSR